MSPDSPRAVRWLSWVLGAAVLGAVVTGALRFSEGKDFIRLAQRAEPWWVVGAVGLQVGTYLAQGWVWLLVSAAAGHRLSRRVAFELAFAKLFVDQALPSAGLSSSILIAKALEQRQVPPPAVNASVLVNIASYHLAYAAALLAALVILMASQDTNAFVVVTAAIFVLFSLAFSGAVLVLSGRGNRSPRRGLTAMPMLRPLADFMAGADARLLRSRRVIAETVALQGAIVLLDAATMWMLILALGVTASPVGVFASFMIASLFRTMGILPGGLGTFEATSVLMLRMVGIDVAVGLSATLLFRGLSFWLPMLPGYWCSHRVLAQP